jgi:hypothetical protein
LLGILFGLASYLILYICSGILCGKNYEMFNPQEIILENESDLDEQDETILIVTEEKKENEPLVDKFNKYKQTKQNYGINGQT